MRTKIAICTLFLSAAISLWISSSPVQATHTCTDYSAVTNTQALYHLEDETDSDNGFDLTNNNSVTFVAGRFTNGGDFEAGSSQSLNIANTLGAGGNTSTTFVISFKPESTPSGTGYTLTSHYEEGVDISYTIQYRDSSGPQLYFVRDRRGIADCSNTYAVTLSTSTFSNIIMTWNGSTLKGYLSGIGEVFSASCSGNGNFSDSTEFAIGKTTDNNGYADGIIDEVIVEVGAWSSSTVDTYWADNFNNCPADAVAGPSTHLIRGHGRTRNNPNR